MIRRAAWAAALLLCVLPMPAIAGAAQSAAAAAPPSVPVVLQVVPTPTRYQAWVDNPLPAPVQVELSLQTARGVIASPALPVRRLLQPGAHVLVATLIVADIERGSDFRLALAAVPGDPAAQPLLGTDYRLPFSGVPIRVDQGPGGHFSHDDAQNHDAIDFAMPEGTPVLAARDGIVIQVEGDFTRAGLDREHDGGRSNFIRVLHADGSMALYAHLKPEGVLVAVGQPVRAGERIGLSGNTGYSTAPHLHFVVQRNAGMRLVSIPVNLEGPLGALRFAH